MYKLMYMYIYIYIYIYIYMCMYMYTLHIYDDMQITQTIFTSTLQARAAQLHLFVVLLLRLKNAHVQLLAVSMWRSHVSCPSMGLYQQEWSLKMYNLSIRQQLIGFARTTEQTRGCPRCNCAYLRYITDQKVK